MLETKLLNLLLMLSIAGLVSANSEPGDVVGRMVVEYLGWFSVQGDSSPRNLWSHWANETSPRKNHITFDLYPDVREYSHLYQTQLANLENGQPAKLFSSWDDSTIDLHFQWMTTYGMDVVALQRCGAALKEFPQLLNHANGIATKVQSFSEKYNRKFFITWNVTDWSNFDTELIDDMNSLEVLGVFQSSAYAIQNGKPVICIQGFDLINEPNDPNDALSVIEQLKEHGFYVIGGVPSNWRIGNSDGSSSPNYLNVYLAFDMIQPWTLGEFEGIYGARIYQAQQRADFEFCTEHNIDYQPVLYPGYRYMVPRFHGDFLWRQFVNIRELGIKNAYLATFDGYHDGTAIAKAAENISMTPIDEHFLTLDYDGVSVSSDFYLRLCHEGYRMMKTDIGFRISHYTPFYPDGTIPFSGSNTEDRPVTELKLKNLLSALINLFQ